MKITYRKLDEQIGEFEFDGAYFLGLAANGPFIGNPVFKSRSQQNPVVAEEKAETIIERYEARKKEAEKKYEAAIAGLTKEEIIDLFNKLCAILNVQMKEYWELKDLSDFDKFVVFFQGDWFQFDLDTCDIKYTQYFYDRKEWPAHWHDPKVPHIKHI